MRRHSHQWILKDVALGLAVLLMVIVLSLAGYVLLRTPRVPGAGQALGYTPAPTTSAPAASSQPPAPVRALVVFIGDSYTVGIGAPHRVGQRWTTLASHAEGWREVNLGVPGTGYATVRGRASYAGLIARARSSRPSLVIVSGGRDDVHVSAAVEAAAVKRFFRALRASLPTTRIVAVDPLWDSTKPPPALTGISRDVQTAVTAVHGIYLNLGEPLAHRPRDIAPDKVHPNAAGYALIALAFGHAYAAIK